MSAGIVVWYCRGAIGLAPHLMTSERNASIIQLFRQGARPADLARQFNISRDRIRKIIDVIPSMKSQA
jgi:DNA-binding CsgD family transcriptional regulator